MVFPEDAPGDPNPWGARKKPKHINEWYQTITATIFGLQTQIHNSYKNTKVSKLEENQVLSNHIFNWDKTSKILIYYKRKLNAYGE